MAILKAHKQCVAVVALLGVCVAGAEAQTPATTRRPAQGPVVVERRPAAPQVITVLHRINGIKMLRLLVRRGQPVGVIDNLDEAFQGRGVHTNIIAGLALDDGETIAAWLPEAEVEIQATLPPQPAAANPPEPAPPAKSPVAAPRARTAPPAVLAFPSLLPPMAFGGSFYDGFLARPDITILERDGTSHQVRYVGLDGITGLSLLKLPEKNLPARPISTELEITVGQQMHLYSPQPAGDAPATTNNAIYVRIGETDGQVVSVARGSSGEVTRIKIKSEQLTPSNIGAVVLNDGGQTIGIVESLEGSEATVLPPAAIRAAARRVLARQTSVPRPWLGVSGESIAAATLDGIVRQGWETRRAMSLLQTQRGILLNSVIPDSPAAQASLHAGDVIVEVNDSVVTNDDDFSLLLAEAAAKPVRISVVRRNSQVPQSMLVELSDSIEPFLWPKMFEGSTRVSLESILLDHGIATVPLRRKVFARPGAVRGLGVINIQPASAAAKAGLQLGDVINAIDGRPVSGLSAGKLELSPAGYKLNILRGKERIVLTVVEAEK